MFKDNRVSDSLDTFENVSALIVAILSERDLLVEQAFEKLANPTVMKFKLEEADYEDMVALKHQGVKTGEIARIYGVDSSTICRKINQQRKKEYKEMVI